MKPVDLIEHPEGGRFHEVFRSEKTVTVSSGNKRSALTHIYFQLNGDEVSQFHKVSSDEIWNLYKGEGIRLYIWNGTEKAPTCIELSEKENCFCHVVPAGMWQAAEPISGEVLLGCSVAPGFEFEDFELIDPDSENAQILISQDASLAKLVKIE